MLPAVAEFAGKTHELAEVATGHCEAEAIRPAYDAAFDDWLQIGHPYIGPSETAALSIAFWPDQHGATTRGLLQMIATRSPRCPRITPRPRSRRGAFSRWMRCCSTRCWQAAARQVDDPGFQDIADAQAWFRLDVLRQRVQVVRDAMQAEPGALLGVPAEFNSAGGD